MIQPDEISRKFDLLFNVYEELCRKIDGLQMQIEDHELELQNHRRRFEGLAQPNWEADDEYRRT